MDEFVKRASKLEASWVCKEASRSTGALAVVLVYNGLFDGLMRPLMNWQFIPWWGQGPPPPPLQSSLSPPPPTFKMLWRGARVAARCCPGPPLELTRGKRQQNIGARRIDAGTRRVACAYSVFPAIPAAQFLTVIIQSPVVTV